MPLSTHASARLRRVAALTAGGALVATGLLVPALAAHADGPAQTQTLALDPGQSLADNGFTGAVASNPSGYDFAVTANGALRASNYDPSNDPNTAPSGSRGNITQLLTPATAEAGEPFYTGAAYDQYHFSFTVDSAVAGSAKYKAQPGLSLEVNADKDGNRAGAGVTLRVPKNNVLELSTYYTTDPTGNDWLDKVANVSFTKPVTIDYTVHFVAGGQDQVTIKANGKTVISGSGSYEGYSYSVDGAPQTVDDVLFRSVQRVPGGAGGASWTNVKLTDAQNSALQGNGLTFADIVYGAQNSGAAAFGTTSTQTVYASQIANYEAGDSSNYTQWHVGSNSDPDAATQYATVDDNGDLVITDPVLDSHSVQVLKGLSDSAQPTDLRALVYKGLAWESDTTDSATFQLPITYGPSNTFTTLVGLTDEGGFQVADLTKGNWWTTHPIGSLLATHNYTLGQILDAIDTAGGNVHVLGFGVSSQANLGEADVDGIWFDGTKYVFSNAPVLVVTSVPVYGVAAVGNTLTTEPEASQPGATFTYQWLRNGAAITKLGTSQSYALTASDLGKQISVKATAHFTGYANGSATSAKTAKVAAGSITADGNVSVNGDAKVGVKLTTTLPAFSPTVSSVSYQWYRDGAKISGATKSAYTVTSSDLGHALTVTATGKKTAYTSLPLTSDTAAAVAKGSLAVTLAPTIKSSVKGGAFVAGKSVTATSNGWTANGAAATGVTKRYFWFVYDASVETSGPSISDLVSVSTGSKFTLPKWAKGQGLSLAVYVVGTKAGFEGVQSDPSIAYAIQ